MSSTIFALCAVASIFVVVLLARAYIQRPSRILFWSAICFVGIALNNIVLFYDLVILPDEISYAVLRNALLAGSTGVLIYGLIWDAV